MAYILLNERKCGLHHKKCSDIFILMFSLTLVRKTINLWLNIKVKTKIVVKSTFWWLTDSIRSSIEKDVDAT